MAKQIETILQELNLTTDSSIEEVIQALANYAIVKDNEILGVKNVSVQTLPTVVRNDETNLKRKMYGIVTDDEQGAVSLMNKRNVLIYKILDALKTDLDNKKSFIDLGNVSNPMYEPNHWLNDITTSGTYTMNFSGVQLLMLVNNSGAGINQIIFFNYPSGDTENIDYRVRTTKDGINWTYIDDYFVRGQQLNDYKNSVNASFNSVYNSINSIINTKVSKTGDTLSGIYDFKDSDNSDEYFTEIEGGLLTVHTYEGDIVLGTDDSDIPTVEAKQVKTKAVSTQENEISIKFNNNTDEIKLTPNSIINKNGTFVFAKETGLGSSTVATQKWTNSKIAEAKQYTQEKIDQIVGGNAHESLDTIAEISKALKDNANVIDTLATKGQVKEIEETINALNLYDFTYSVNAYVEGSTLVLDGNSVYIDGNTLVLRNGSVEDGTLEL